MAALHLATNFLLSFFLYFLGLFFSPLFLFRFVLAFSLSPAHVFFGLGLFIFVFVILRGRLLLTFGTLIMFWHSVSLLRVVHTQVAVFSSTIAVRFVFLPSSFVDVLLDGLAPLDRLR